MLVSLPKIDLYSLGNSTFVDIITSSTSLPVFTNLDNSRNFSGWDLICLNKTFIVFFLSYHKPSNARDYNPFYFQ